MSATPNKSIIRVTLERIQVSPTGVEVSEYTNITNSKRLSLQEAKNVAKEMLPVLGQWIDQDEDSDLDDVAGALPAKS